MDTRGVAAWQGAAPAARGGVRGAAGFLALVLLAGALSLLWRPAGFGGGWFDDQRYLDAALAWWQDGPQVGATHWALRHTLIASLLAGFALRGPTSAATVPVAGAWFLLALGVGALALRHHASPRTAAIWTALFIATPLFHRAGTRLYPEIVELALATASLWAFYTGLTAQGRVRAAWFVAAGTAMALAMLTRQTAWFLPVLYAILFAFDAGGSRRAYGWLAAGALPWLAAETLLLHAATGGWLYRMRVDLGHVRVPTDQMAGGTFAGQVLMNPDLGSRWQAIGAVRLHWAVDPWANLFADPSYGLLFWTVGLLCLWVLPRDRDPALRRALIALAAVGLLHFTLVTYVLMLAQRPRYHGMLVYAATVAAALLADRALTLRLHRRVAWLGGATLLVALACVGSMRRYDTVARLALPAIAAARMPVQVDPAVMPLLATPLAERGLSTRVTTSPPPVGALALRVVGRFDAPQPQAPLPGRWRLVRRLDPPRPFGLLRPDPSVELLERVG